MTVLGIAGRSGRDAAATAGQQLHAPFRGGAVAIPPLALMGCAGAIGVVTATGALFDIAHITCTLATLAVALVAWLDPGATSHSRRAEWAALIALAGAALLAAGGVSLGLLLALGAIGWIVQLWWWRP